MRHARVDDLARLAPLLGRLRAIASLTERTPGAFYRKSTAFLHFHVAGEDVFCDVKLSGSAFERVRVTSLAERRALLERIEAALAGE
jgi:hypothetical protein